MFNGLTLLLMAKGMIAGPILNISTLVACLTVVGTVVKGWSEFKKFSVKVDMCRFAYTTYAKALIELRTYGRAFPLTVWKGLWSRCKPWTTRSSISLRLYPNAACRNTVRNSCTNPSTLIVTGKDANDRCWVPDTCRNKIKRPWEWSVLPSLLWNHGSTTKKKKNTTAKGRKGPLGCRSQESLRSDTRYDQSFEKASQRETIQTHGCRLQKSVSTV